MPLMANWGRYVHKIFTNEFENNDDSCLISLKQQATRPCFKQIVSWKTGSLKMSKTAMLMTKLYNNSTLN